MLPSIDIRIQTLLRAMQTVVMPALDANNSLAQEQARLVVAHLDMMARQWDKAYLFEVQSLQAMNDLGIALYNSASGGKYTRAAGVKLRGTVEEASLTEPRTATEAASMIRSIGTAVDELIIAITKDGDSVAKSAMQSEVIGYSKVQARKERIWFASSNLDPDRSQLGSIEDMLGS